MKSEYVLGKIIHSKEVIKLISHLRLFDKSEVAKERQKIISFYDTYGERATREAFGVDRKLIYLWRKRIKARGGLNGLVPGSQAPKNPRRSRVAARIIEFIRSKREFVPRMSKKKLKPLLDEFCLKEGLAAISTATIGRVIKRNNLFFYKTGRVYHNPEGRWAQESLKTRKKARIKYAPRPADIGYIQMDTVEKIIDGRIYDILQLSKTTRIFRQYDTHRIPYSERRNIEYVFDPVYPLD